MHQHIPQIIMRAIPHEQHRYETVGDYWEEDRGRKVNFRVSRMNRWEYEFLVMAHELIEYFLVKKAGVSVATIDKFDKKMEKGFLQYSHYGHNDIGTIFTPCFGKNCLTGHGEVNRDEPGICARAPYHQQHMLAMKIEKVLCRALGLSWKEYDRYVQLF